MEKFENLIILPNSILVNDIPGLESIRKVYPSFQPSVSNHNRTLIIDDCIYRADVIISIASIIPLHTKDELLESHINTITRYLTSNIKNCCKTFEVANNIEFKLSVFYSKDIIKTMIKRNTNCTKSLSGEDLPYPAYEYHRSFKFNASYELETNQPYSFGSQLPLQPFSFGTSQPQTQNGFGNTSTTQPFNFGNASSSSSSSSSSTSTGGFGIPSTTSTTQSFNGGFGIPSTTSTMQSFNGGFGIPSTTSTTQSFNGGFGTPSTTQPYNAFGNSSTTSTTQPYSAFGNTNSKQVFGFGNTSTSSTTNNVFKSWK